MSVPSKTRQHILANQPAGEVNLSKTFKLVETNLPGLKDGQVLIKAIYYSNDPAQRVWIQPDQDPARLYTTPVNEGDVMRAFAIGTVVDSKSSKLQKDALVSAPVGWAEYAVLDDKDVRILQNVEGVSESHFLGAFGGPGLTAMHGLNRARATAEDDLIVISGAAGATGSMAVQIAKKIIGVKKVIGIAGTDEKCQWVEKLGADQCLNYKSSSFKENLAKACQGKANVYYDNVGGEILDLMMAQMAMYGRIIACGAISQYNSKGEGVSFKNWYEVIFMRLEIIGIIIFDAGSKLQDYTLQLVQAYKDGKITVDVENETVVPTKFEDIPKTWHKLFEGGNQGKLITKLLN